MVTDAVIAKVQEVWGAYLNPERLQPTAEAAVNEADKSESYKVKFNPYTSSLTAWPQILIRCILLEEPDFDRIYQRIKEWHGALEKALKTLAQEVPFPAKGRARNLVQQFWDGVFTSQKP